MTDAAHSDVKRRRAVLLEAELADPPDTRLSTWLVFVGIAAVAGAVVWAYFAPLKEVVVGEGRILPWTETYTLQHRDGGRVVSVFAREGDTVEEGTPLVAFDRSDERALVAQLAVRAEALEAELARARALAEGSAFAPDVSSGEANAILSAQVAVFDVQTEARQNRLDLLQADVDLARARLEETRALIVNLKRREIIEAKRFEDFERLSGSRGVVSRRDRDRAELDVIETRSQLASAHAREKTAILDMRRAQNAMAEFEVLERRRSIERASELEAELAETRKQLERRAAIAAREILVSPHNGRIQTMTITGPDQVVQPGGIVAQLVPENHELVAELTVSADRIGQVAPGTPVSIKVLTFDFTRFGAIEGEVIDVSPTSDIGGNGMPGYRVRVALSKTHVGTESAALALRPGLAVLGDIILGERTVMEYLMKPLRVAKDRAMTES